MALATISNYEIITGQTVASGDEPRIEALLEMASDAIINGAHGQLIAEATSIDVELRPHAGVCYFPQRPVVAVESVAIVNADGTEEALTEGDDYRWTPGGDRRPAKLIRRRFGRDDWWGSVTDNSVIGEVSMAEPVVKVTYTHGWNPAPGPIIGTVCAMVRAMVSSGGGPAMQQTSVGPFSGTVADGEAQSPSMELTGSAQRMLDRWCGVSGPTSAPVLKGAP
jgi:hypothetical protein